MAVKPIDQIVKEHDQLTTKVQQLEQLLDSLVSDIRPINATNAIVEFDGRMIMGDWNSLQKWINK